MVVYQDPEAAKAAINWFNGKYNSLVHRFMFLCIVGKEFCGRTVKVEFATYLEKVGGGGYRGGRDWGGGGGRGGGDRGFRGGGGGDRGFRGGGDRGFRGGGGDRGGGRGFRGDGGFRGRGGGGRGRGGGMQPSEGDWICPDPA